MTPFAFADSTRLSGTLPPALGFLASLMDVELYETQLSGTVPTGMCATALDLHGCLISSIGILTGCQTLTSLDVSDNLLTSLPTGLPPTLTHLYLGSNPLHNSAVELGSLLHALPALAALDVGFLELPVQLSVVGTQGGTRITMPPAGDCRLGSRETPACRLKLQLYDNQSKVVKVGGLKPNLTFGTDCDVYTATLPGWDSDSYGPATGRWNCHQVSPVPMADNGDGSYTATIPSDWSPPNIKTPLLVSFFDTTLSMGAEDNLQFFPLWDSGGGFHQDWVNTGAVAVPYEAASCNTAAHTRPDPATGAFCVCQDERYKPDATAASGSAALAGCSRVCPNAGEVPDSSSPTGCACAPGYYDVQAAGAIGCVGGTGGWEAALTGGAVATAAANLAAGRRCSSCSLVEQCADCSSSGRVSVHAGFRTNATNLEQELTKAAASASGSAVLIFRCPDGVGETGCPAFVLGSGPDGRLTDAPTNGTGVSLGCGGNQTGLLCGSCAPGYAHTLHGGGQHCESCDSSSLLLADYGTTSRVLLGAAALAALLLLVTAGKLVGCLPRLASLRQAVQANLKILVGLAQVLTLLSSVLGLLFPPAPRQTLSYAALIIVDCKKLFQLNCQVNDFYDRTMLSIFCPPLAVAAVVGGRWFYMQRVREQDPVAARVAAAELGWFCTMLLYPQLSATIFKLLQCRELGPALSVLEDDYGVLCTSPDDADAAARYRFFYVVGLALVAAVPVGIPCALLAALLRARRRALHAADEDDSDGEGWAGGEQEDGGGGSLVDRAHQRLHAQGYGFAIADFRAGCLWYEPVDLLRKLALTGLLQFFWRGTAAQAACGCTLAVLALVGQVWLQPYREPVANMLKLMADFQIFFTFLISFVLRVLSNGNGDFGVSEPAKADFYGYLLLGTWATTVGTGLALTGWQVRRRWAFQARMRSAVDFAGGGFGDGGVDGSRLLLAAAAGSGGEARADSRGGEEMVDYRRSQMWRAGGAHAGAELPSSGLLPPLPPPTAAGGRDSGDVGGGRHR